MNQHNSMFKHELDPTPSEDSQSIKKLLPSVIFNHHTARWHQDMTYGGLHRDQASAQAGFIGRNVRDFTDLVDLAAAWRKGEFHIVELKEGEEYRPHGTSRNYTHGVNDGTHGSSIEDPRDAQVLMIRNNV